MAGLGAFYELDVLCRGELDPATGYLMDIKAIDRAVREAAIPRIVLAVQTRPSADPGEVLAGVLPPLAEAVGPCFAGVRWRLSPYYSVQMLTSDPGTVLMRQRFDFAAAHRLHMPTLSDEENRARFGKCNNATGHGHNYQVEPCVALTLDAGTTPVAAFSLGMLERLTDEAIIQRFDHKHLNLDTVEFSSAGGLNPSVENIARVCYELLSKAIDRAIGGGTRGNASLRSVTVWETDRTCCTYPADHG